MTNLTSLNMDEPYHITNDGVERLTNLTSLSIYHNSNITDEALRNMTSLTKLYIYGEVKICDFESLKRKGVEVINLLQEYEEISSDDDTMPDII